MDETELHAFFVTITLPFPFFSPFNKKRRIIKRESAVITIKIHAVPFHHGAVL